jgi:hypothetical protein
MSMNEATFEAALHRAVTRIFPNVRSTDISHQASFKLRFGRHDVVVDGDLKDSASARLDVLVALRSRPVLLLELKRPGHMVGQDDVDQARSYARLLADMPPFFGVSNGEDTRLFTTVDSKPWTAETVDDHAVEEMIRSALACAADDQDAAVTLLLGREPSRWVPLIRAETATALTRLEGEANDFSAPVVRGFHFPRTLTPKISEFVRGPSRALVLVGPPLSGKTNVLAQFCRTPGEGIVPLYVDASSLGHGVWQHIASAFASTIFTGSSLDEARHWVSQRLRQSKGFTFVLVVDGWAPGTGHGDLVRQTVDELVAYCEQGSLKLVLALDDSHFERLSRVPGRTTATALGRIAKVVSLLPLDHEEFHDAERVLWAHASAAFYPGAEYNQEFRAPRLWRILLSGLEQARGTQSGSQGIHGPLMVRLHGIADTQLLEGARRSLFPDPEMVVDMERVATALIDVKEPSSLEGLVARQQLGRSVVPMDAAETALGTERMERLRKHGFLRMVESREGVILQSTAPELVAAAAPKVIARRIEAQTNAEERYRTLIEGSERLPLSDVVGAMVLADLARNRIDLVQSLAEKLLNDGPTQSQIAPGSQVAVIASDVTFNVSFPDGFDEPTLGNLLPWLILSHFASLPIETSTEFPSIGGTILSIVGACPYLLRRHDTVPLDEMPSFHFHAVPGNGDVPCPENGIVEPITQSMLLHFWRAPNEMRELAAFATGKDGSIHLAWRLLTAALQMESATNPATAAAAADVETICKDYWKKTFQTEVPHSRDDQ